MTQSTDPFSLFFASREVARQKVGPPPSRHASKAEQNAWRESVDRAQRDVVNTPAPPAAVSDADRAESVRLRTAALAAEKPGLARAMLAGLEEGLSSDIGYADDLGDDAWEDD